MNLFKVYKHTFPNGKVYIGMTKQNVYKRWFRGKGYRHNKKMLEAVKIFGWDNIKHEILFEYKTEKEALKKETELIIYYKSNNDEYGYNICTCANRTGVKISEESRLKISESKKGSIPVNRKPVEQLDKEGNLVNKYNSVMEASKKTGIDFRLISAVCLEKRKTTGGYIWRFLNIM